MGDFVDEGLYDEDNSQDDAPIRFPISCTNVPESLFDDNGSATKHFGKFGTISKILLRPSKQTCIVEYENRDSAERAILNAGAYDGFMFDVTWSKQRKRPKVNDDPDWLPDPDVAAELAAMANSGTNILPRLHRQQKMDFEKSSPILPAKRISVKKTIVKKKTKPVENVQTMSQPAPSNKSIDREELRQLVGRAYNTTEERLKALESRDRIIRAGLPSRLGAIQGCCPDMCPERERLVREFQRQVAPYEIDPSEQNSTRLDARKAVKQYSRSSADQEEPLSHDLRPVPVLQQTLLYLLHHIVDQFEDPMTSLEDWFHFMWDRLRAIRKDITQQALCCTGSVALVEACARFHAHCAARLVEEPPSTFDQRLNTENLSKCLQSLKYMYGDLRARGQADACRCEPEFRAYVVLLNMHDSNFMWEVQHLDPEVQRSPEIRFAIKVFTALDNNNYVMFFKLVKETSYLNACILLRYFNDVRARALSRMIKSYAPRWVSQFPANELMEMLAFENLDSMALFLEHYGLQMASDQESVYVILDKNSFHDSSTPYAPERAVNLVESKLETSLGEVVYGDELPASSFDNYTPHCSFETSGFIKKTAILAEDQGYQPPKERIQEIANILRNSSVPIRNSSETKIQETNSSNQFSKIASSIVNRAKSSDFVFAKPEMPKGPFSKSIFDTNPTDSGDGSNSENVNIFRKEPSTNFFSTDNKFVFSKPAEAKIPNLFAQQPTPGNIFSKEDNKSESQIKSNIFSTQLDNSSNQSIFSNASVPAAPFGFKTKMTPFYENNSSNSVAPANNIFNTAAKSLFGDAAANIPQDDNRKALEEEQRRKAAEDARKKREEEDRRTQERIKEEKRKQEELKRKIEEERKILEIAKQKAEQEKRMIELAKQKEFEKQEKERKTKELEIRIEKQLGTVIPEITNEVVNDLCYEIMEEELQRLRGIIDFTFKIAEDLINEVCVEECTSASHAAIRLDEIRLRIICRSVSRLWRYQVIRSKRRRSLLHMTPTWLPDRPPPSAPPSQAYCIQRMKDFHRGKLPTFRVPSFKHHTINLFETVKKYLFKRSQELKQKSTTLNVNWKIVTSIPGENQSRKCSLFYSNWLKDVFTDSQVEPFKHQIYLSENYWYKKFALSVTTVRGDELVKTDPALLNAMGGLNGLIFYSSKDSESLPCLMKRICNTVLCKCDLECVPMVLILASYQNGDISTIESGLDNYKTHRFISESKIIKMSKFDEENLTASSREAFKWLAKRLSKNPVIESQLLSTYLDHCIGSELWYRFKLSLNSSLRKAFYDIKILINLYNEAVRKATDIVCNPELLKYPVSPNEFHEYLNTTHVYPKEYEYISSNWKSNIPALKGIIRSFEMPQYTEIWPHENYVDFQASLKKIVSKLNWFKNSEKVILKVLSIIKDPPLDEEFSFDDSESKYSWIEIMNILVSEKIIETVKHLKENITSLSYQPDLYSGDFTVVYRPRELNFYRTSPWWYNSACMRDVNPLVEDYPDDMSDLDVSNPKKRKLDISDDSEIPDETWLSTVLVDMENTIKQTSQCNKMYSDLEKSLDLEKQKQIEFENLLRSALGDDWNPNESVNL